MLVRAAGISKVRGHCEYLGGTRPKKVLRRIVLKNSYTARWGQIWENKIPNYSDFAGVTRRNQSVGERFPTFQKFAVAAKSFSTEWAES